MSSDFTIAVHALVFLNHKGRNVCSEELAQNICTNPARVRKVLAKLKQAGLVETKEGLGGGYCFQLLPGQVTLEQVLAALGEEVVSASWHSGSAEQACLIASGMAGIMDQLYGGMDQAARQYLMQITIADVDHKIFGAGATQQKE